MNMADSRPRPVPRPRARQKSLPASTADVIECFSSSFSPPTSNKPPITKPKPPGYKTLDYSNKGLVSITAEIDIGDEQGSWKPAPSGKKQMEDNNNLENSKNLSRQKDQESLSKDAKSCEQPQTASALCKSYTKPLPPLPAEAWSPKPQLRRSLNLETFSKELKEKKCDIASSTRTPPLPRKPPRLYLSDDSVNAQSRSSVEKPSVAAKKPGAITVNGTHNPPLPRKPTMLRRRSTGTASSEVKSNTAAPQETMVDSEDQAKKETNIKTMDSTFEKSRSLRETRSGSVGNKNSIRTQLSSALQSKNSGDLDTELPGNSSLSLKQTQSEDSIIANHCHPQPSFDKPSKVHLSSSDGQFVPSGVEFGDKSSCSANVGCTPSLPKKTGRRLSPALEKHLQTVKNRDDSVQTNDRQPSLPSHTTTNQQDASGNCSNSNQDNQRSGTSGSRSTNISPPSSQIKRKPPESKSKNANQLSENVVNPQKGATRVPVEPGAKNGSAKESEVERNKQGRSGKSASNAKQKPPQTSPPDLPSLPSLSPEPSHAKHTPPLSPPRRLPPGPPTQLSVQEGKRKSEAPPPPKAPRPKSVLRDNALKKKKSSRSQSMGNLFEDSSEDPEYWVAYQHLRQLSPSQCDEAFDSDDGEYESPDKNVLRGFIASMERKHGPLNLKHDETKDGYEAPDQEVVGSMKSVKKPKDNQNKSEPGVAMEETEHSKKTTTYSSSSDDSDHEYEEPDSPKVERKESEKDRGVLSSSSRSSSDRSGNYVETICPDETEKRKNGSENSTKKYEFKPFKDMSGEWTKPKEINWEYNGSSDDSDGSYVEPDADDDDEEFELGDEEEEEPLYQIYQANVLEKERTLSLKRRKKSSVSECLPTSPGIGTLRFGTLRGGKMLWSQLPEVRNGEVLENMSAEQRKLQEAIFEVISSEASYLKSLNLLLDHFLTSKLFTYDAPDSVLNEVQVSELFSNIKEIVKVSESFLNDLRTRQRQSVIIDSISDIITDHATNQFKAYVTYCSTQYKQDRMLSSLKKTNCKFAEALEKLERDRRVFGLTLQSFLVLPMQRVTRYPLLVDAIVRRCEPGHSEYYRTDEALKAVNKVVYMCNEGARNEERHEEMLQIEKVVAFFKMKPIQLVTTDRWLARRGPLQLLEFDRKSTLSSTLRGKFRKYRVKTIYLFLFSDLLVVTKKKSDVVYSVIDFASRNMIRVQEANSNAKNSFILVLLENFEKKTKELHMRVDNETELTRWKEAFEPPKAETDDEKIYGSWDCPQVHALHNYQAQQSDELSLVPGDVVNVLRKLPDGWYEGERIRDGMCGWFPANHTEEIRNEHVRARNLHQRYRLLAASTAFLDKRKR